MSPSPPQNMKRKILIIDDEIDFCMIMQGFFTKRNYEVLTAHTLQEGLALLHEKKPEILFLDNNLPDGNGWNETRRIVEIIPQIMVYLISAHRNISPLKGYHKNVVVWEKPISLQKLNELF